MTGLLDAALGYAARGIPVYPVHWPRPTQGEASLACSCPRGPACDRPAKHPLVRHGIKDATTEAAQLERWWQRWPAANIGLATGVMFDVLDVDGPTGLAGLRQLATTADLRLSGPLVATGGGGWHYWFHPTGLGCRPPRGLAQVDWRGRGGAVLAPPSRHVSGEHYRWLRGLDQVPLPEVPAALRALLDPQPVPATAAIPPRPVTAGDAYGREVLAVELATLGRAAPGQRNRTLNRCAFKVYRYVAGGLLDDQAVTTVLTEAALAIGLGAAEVRRTLASARTGLAVPRPDAGRSRAVEECVAVRLGCGWVRLGCGSARVECARLRLECAGLRLGCARVRQAAPGQDHQQLHRQQQRDRRQGSDESGGVADGGVGDVNRHRYTRRRAHQRPGIPGIPGGGDRPIRERQPQDDQGGRGGERVHQQRRAEAQPWREGADPHGKAADRLEADHEGECGDGEHQQAGRPHQRGPDDGQHPAAHGVRAWCGAGGRPRSPSWSPRSTPAPARG